MFSESFLLLPLLRLRRRGLQQQRRERHVLVVLQRHRLAKIKPTARRRGLSWSRCHSGEQTLATGHGGDRLSAAGDRRRRRGGDGRGGRGDRTCGESAGAGGGDDGSLGVAEKPLDSLAVGAVAELARELEDPGGAHRRHPHAPPPAIDLRVAVPR